VAVQSAPTAAVQAAPQQDAPPVVPQAVPPRMSLAQALQTKGQDVLLLVDSLTRYAMAQREIALALGEPPATKGYPPSVFGMLPELVESAGNGESGSGSLSAIYTVLAEGDDANDPIVDIARASLDGQVMLSRKLADAAHYPAIDLNGSVSRVMQNLISPEDQKLANRFRRLWSLYQQNQDLIQVGAYEAGSNADLDQAIRLRSQMESFLQQDMHTSQDAATTRLQVQALMTQ
jgi:flagellum-specific ATP synthase